MADGLDDGTPLSGSAEPEIQGLSFVGHKLVSPECVLAFANDDLLVTNRSCGATLIRAGGSQHDFGNAATVAEHQMIPNGIAVSRRGQIFLANVGPSGGIWEIVGNTLRPHLLEADGLRLQTANFVYLDELDRMWITISTRQLPRERAFRPNVADGYIVLVDEKGARIVADGLAFANELRVGANGMFLYVNETFRPSVTRFRVRPDGSLHERTMFGALPQGSYPDGLALDQIGGVWVTALVSNALYRFGADGARRTILQESNENMIESAHRAFISGRLSRALLDASAGKRLRSISSVAFGSADRKTMYLGCLLGDTIVSLRVPVAGVRPVHWDIHLETGRMSVDSDRVKPVGASNNRRLRA